MNQHTLEARHICDRIATLIRRKIRNKDGFEVGVETAHNISIGATLLDIMEKGLLHWVDPRVELRGIPVLFMPDLHPCAVRVVFEHDHQTYRVMLEHERVYAAKQNEEICEPRSTPTRDIVRNIVRRTGSKDPGVQDWIDNT